MPVTLHSSAYGVLPDGRAVNAHHLSTGNGVRVTLLDYGATLAAVETPDRSGQVADVTHGFDDLNGWLGNRFYFGANVGRFANRIAGGRFSLDGKTYQLATNNRPGGIPCHLHGGNVGFDKRLWTSRPVQDPHRTGVEFRYLSPDGEEGYPGNLSVTVSYWLAETNELSIEFRASTDQATIINLTNHVYWNLTANSSRQITGHQVRLESDAILPVNAGLIPVGSIAPTRGTPFDFTQFHAIGSRIEAADPLLKLANGYDHCWVLREEKGLRLAARVHEPESGRKLELFTDQPGLQFYTGNFLDGTAQGKHGANYPFRTAFCLEPQNFPDAPNHRAFPSAVLRPGENYSRTLKYRFSHE